MATVSESIIITQSDDFSFSVPGGGGNTTFYTVPTGSYAVLSHYGLPPNVSMTVTTNAATFTLLSVTAGTSALGPDNLLSGGTNIRLSNSGGSAATAKIGIIEFKSQ